MTEMMAAKTGSTEGKAGSKMGSNGTDSTGAEKAGMNASKFAGQTPTEAVKAMQAKGYSDQGIKTAMTKQGYSEKQIQQALGK